MVSACCASGRHGLAAGSGGGAAGWCVMLVFGFVSGVSVVVAGAVAERQRQDQGRRRWVWNGMKIQKMKSNLKLVSGQR